MSKVDEYKEDPYKKPGRANKPSNVDKDGVPTQDFPPESEGDEFMNYKSSKADQNKSAGSEADYDKIKGNK